MVQRRDVAWAGGATRVAKTIGVAPRADVQAIVDAANAETRRPRNQVIGTQAFDIIRDPDPLHESAMGNLVADAMLDKYPGVERPTRTRAGCGPTSPCTRRAPARRRARSRWGELFAVLPFGNAPSIETLTGAQMQQAFLNGFSPFCDPAIKTGRFPQIAGLKVDVPLQRHRAVIDGMWKTPDGPADRDADRRRPTPSAS